MKKLEINYDFIDKINESEGKYKLKRLVKEFPYNLFLTAGFVTRDSILYFTDQITLEEALGKVASDVIIYGVIVFGIGSMYYVLKDRILGSTREERAESELLGLVTQLNNLNIKVNLDLLKEANVYHKKYSLLKDGRVGIMRERYIEVPTYDNSNNTNTTTASIKEEHVMGTRKYVLTLDTPKKELVYKPAFNM